MINAVLIMNRFKTLAEFERFALEWAETCCMVNKSSRNKNEVERWRKAVEVREERPEPYRPKVTKP